MNVPWHQLLEPTNEAAQFTKLLNMPTYQDHIGEAATGNMIFFSVDFFRLHASQCVHDLGGFCVVVCVSTNARPQ
jgi:hypothetical protein